MKILLGMSGGVDSAYSALRLREMGHEVEGCILIMHEYSETSEARKCAEDIGIVLHEVDAVKSFINIVKENFVEEYSKGRTPNPCIICNERVKFRALLDYALDNGFDAIATGHYARVVKRSEAEGGGYAIGRAADEKKDQSYMLYRLPEDILSRLVLPLSDVTKEQVRELSAEANLGAADRKDSQEICFLPDGDYAGYVETVKGRFPKGNFIDTEGRVLGEHNGIIRYTVGQRKGLGIALGERAFVTRIDPGSNEITLSTAPMGVSELMLSDVVYSGIKSSEKLSAKHLFAKVRYTAPLVPVTAEVVGEGRVKVKFEIPIKAAPGQSCVLYDGDVIALGGIIE